MRMPLILALLLACTAMARSQPASSETAAAAPLTITLRDAIARAQANSPAFRQALIAYGIAKQDRFQARAGMLPSVTYNNQYLYTEGNGTLSGVFIANNAVHEYVSQADAHEALSLSQLADYRRARAVEALARAQQEVALRGLVQAVVQDYSSLVVAQHKYATAQDSTAAAQGFLKLTQELERGREVARADVVKAQLQYQDRELALSNAQLAMEQARLQLAILLFPNFNQNFEVVDNLQSSAALPPEQTLLELARKNDPELRTALAARDVAQKEVAVAKAAYIPGLTLDYYYGIDADHFATESRAIPPALGQVQNLGYSAQATLNIPVWNWGITRSKVRQARLRVESADVQLQYAQRKLIADFQSAYQAAGNAAAQTDLLRSSVTLAADSLRLTTLRYKAGEATALEVVSAQDALALEKDALVDAEANYANAIARLQAIAGPF
jgi:outer membrane protein